MSDSNKGTEEKRSEDQSHGQSPIKRLHSVHSESPLSGMETSVRDGLDQIVEDVERLESKVATRVEKLTGAIDVPATIAELTQVTNYINDALSLRECPPAVQNKVNICLEELFVNVAHYAYGGDTGRARVSYALLPDRKGIAIEISDEGTPFNPLEAEDPERPQSVADAKIGGLGIFMTKMMADEVTYEYKDGRNNTVFTFYW